ncbi:MAG: prolipoprotein diacylglyceryl transferase [Nitrospirae bacterium]|nr:prolipoprotein diacylglyceryl transferase [Nitrospirota bacterium]
MISFPNIDPVILKIGHLSVRWYGMMYIIGFASSYLLIRYQMKKKGFNSGKAFVDTLYSYIILGLLIGARLGYVFFYNRSYYIRHPFEIFALWYGGMSFHGGLIGSIIAGIIVCRKFKIDFWQIADIVVVTAPIGLGLGRLGNFINGELYGRITNVPWAMVFPAGGPYPRHPSQVYEFLLEGASLFIILWFLKDRKLKPGILSSLFLILYGSFRFFVEFFREPDPQLGFILGLFTMGQILSAVMITLGVGLLFYKSKQWRAP